MALLLDCVSSSSLRIVVQLDSAVAQSLLSYSKPDRFVCLSQRRSRSQCGHCIAEDCKTSRMWDLREDQACTDLCAADSGLILVSKVNGSGMNSVSRVASGTATVDFILTRCAEGRV